MTRVLTSFIQHTHVDFDALAARFELDCISYKDLSQDRCSELHRQLPGRVYHSGPVLALLHYAKAKEYWLIRPRGHGLQLQDAGLALRSEPFGRVAEWIVRSLLMRALPRLLCQPDHGHNRIEADGIYYVVATRDKSRGREMVTVKVDSAYSQAAKRWQLTLGVTTFTELDCHRDEHGNLNPKVAKSTRYQLDTIGQQIRRSAGGEYIKKALSSRRKNRVTAVDLPKDVTLESYYQTRLGVLSMFLDDLQTAYQGAFGVRLATINPDEHSRLANRCIDDAYGRIDQWFQGRRVVVVNHSQHPQASAALLARLAVKGISAQAEVQIQPGELNLLLVEPKDTYAQQPDQDPYQQARQRFPDVVMQACYPERLEGKSLKDVVDVLLKELLIKQEVHTGYLQLDYPPLPADAWFIHPVRPSSGDVSGDVSGDDEELSRNARWPLCYARLVDNRLEFGWLPDALEADLKIGLSKAEQQQLYSGFNRPDVIFWPTTGDFMLVADTGAVTLPSESQVHAWVKQLDQTRLSGVPTGHVRDCLTAMAAEPDQSHGLYEQLCELCRLYPHTIPAEVFDAIKYQSQHSQRFFNQLADLGFRLKASWRSEQQGPLFITSGIWRLREQGLYAAGSAGPANTRMENFSHIYRVESTFPGPVPEWFWQSLAVYHIKHKGFTVYPWVFKHLREYSPKAGFVSFGASVQDGVSTSV